MFVFVKQTEGFPHGQPTLVQGQHKNFSRQLLTTQRFIGLMWKIDQLCLGKCMSHVFSTTFFVMMAVNSWVQVKCMPRNTDTELQKRNFVKTIVQYISKFTIKI